MAVSAGTYIHPTVPHEQLTQNQIDDFHRHGFLSLARITSADEVDWLREKIALVLKNPRAFKRGDYFDFGTAEDNQEFALPQMTRLVDYAPELFETRHYKNAEAIARQLLGPQAGFVFDHAMIKPAAGGRPTPWHQDQAFYRKGSKIESLTIWMPLQDVTKESGCLNFIPGSHLKPLHRHQSIKNDPRIHGLEALDVDEGNAVHCPLSAGGATIHHDGTLHSAGANSSHVPRLAYALIFGVRTKEVLRKEYPWNVGKQTERERRWQNSRTLVERVRRRVRSIRLNLY
jgi:phytanoyl-CoA dioxygenase PhyH